MKTEPLVAERERELEILGALNNLHIEGSNPWAEQVLGGKDASPAWGEQNRTKL